MTPTDEVEVRDATRRTRLANERTYLAWWRTGLTAVAVSVGFGKLVPALTDTSDWPFVIGGVGFAVVGTFFIAYGSRRYTQVERALDHGGFTKPDPRLVFALAAAGVALGVFTLVLVVTS